MKKLFGLVTILFFPLLSMDQPEKSSWIFDKKIPTKQKINSIEFAPLSNQIRTLAGNGKQIQIWNVETGEQEVSCVLDIPVTALGFDKNETRCMAIGREGQRCGFDLVRCELSYKYEKLSECDSEDITFNDDCTLALMQSYRLATLFNALTGEIKETLWKISDVPSSNKAVCAGFVGSVTNVFHDGALGDHKGSEDVKYRALVPEKTSAPMYSDSEKKLVCFHSKHCFEENCFGDLRKISVIDVETETVESFNLIIHPDTNTRYEKQLLDGGSCLGIYFIGIASGHSYFDVYSLKTLKLIFSRQLKDSLCSKPCLKKSLLALLCGDAIELWNVGSKQKITDLESSNLVDINEQGDKIAIAKESGIIIFKHVG